MTSEADFLSQFGASLYVPSSKTTVPTAESLTGKHVMLYFSAHWCPPCRRFTPILIEMYKKLAASERSDFELVFVSLDNTDKEYDAYTSTMPWKCVPFEGTQELRNKLAMKYGAQGIPHLVVVSSEEPRTVITDDGTTEVQMDPEGKNFPWKPKSFAEIWPKNFLTKDGPVDSSTLDSKYLMLYFSAHWCPPCKMFTPTLSNAYKTMKKDRDDFELVFVSSDKDEEAFKEYYGSMSFSALPFEEREAKALLSKRFGIRGIPSLLILGPLDPSTGERPLINENLRGIIEAGDFSDFPFVPKNYQDLAFGADGINEHKSLVILCEGEDDDEQKEIIDSIKAAAEGKEEYRFFYATQPGGVISSIRRLLSIENKLDAPIMALLDIPDNGGYYLSKEADFTKETIEKFLQSPGERHQMKN